MIGAGIFGMLRRIRLGPESLGTVATGWRAPD
jgi:hypothetical protein